MADLVDIAQQREEEHRQAALARVRAQLAPAEEAPAARDCASCGDPIPPERLAALPNATDCTPCQMRRERRRAR